MQCIVQGVLGGYVQRSEHLSRTHSGGPKKPSHRSLSRPPRSRQINGNCKSSHATSHTPDFVPHVIAGFDSAVLRMWFVHSREVCWCMYKLSRDLLRLKEACSLVNCQSKFHATCKLEQPVRYWPCSRLKVFGCKQPKAPLRNMHILHCRAPLSPPLMVTNSTRMAAEARPKFSWPNNVLARQTNVWKTLFQNKALPCVAPEVLQPSATWARIDFQLRSTVAATAVV